MDKFWLKEFFGIKKSILKAIYPIFFEKIAKINILCTEENTFSPLSILLEKHLPNWFHPLLKVFGVRTFPPPPLIPKIFISPLNPKSSKKSSPPFCKGDEAMFNNIFPAWRQNSLRLLKLQLSKQRMRD